MCHYFDLEFVDAQYMDLVYYIHLEAALDTVTRNSVRMKEMQGNEWKWLH